MGYLSGIIAGIIFILSYLPQLKTLRKNDDVAGISILFWVLISLATTVTASNLWESHSPWFLIVPQFINAFIATLILLWVAYKKDGFYGLWVFFMIYLFLGGVFTYKLENEFIQHWSSVFVFFAYLEQIFHMIIKKTTQGINYLLYAGFALGLLVMTVNILTTDAPNSTALTESINIFMMFLAIGVTVFINKKYK